MPYTPTLAASANGPDFAVNSYSSVGGGGLTQTVFSQYDYYKPNELVQVFERHGYKPTWRAQLRAMGFNRGTAAPTIGHYEAPWKKSLVQFDSIITASTGAGTNIVARIAASHMYVPGTTGATVNGAAARASYPIVGDNIRFRDGAMGRVIAKDTTTNPNQHYLTVRPLQTTTDLALSLVTGQEYFIATNTHAEGSAMPVGRVPRLVVYNNEFMIVKNAAIATGSELSNQTYFEPISGMPGSYFMRVNEDMMYLFEEFYDGGLLWGQTTNNIREFNPELGHDTDVKGTEGLMAFGETSGFNDTYTIGSYSFSDFYVVSDYYEGQRNTNWNLHCLQGTALRNEIEEVFVSALDNDMAALLTEKYFYGGMVGETFRNDFMDESPFDAGDFAMRIGFRALKIAGFTYSFCSFNQFNEAVGAGATGYNYRNYQVIMPIGYMAEKSSGTERPTVGYEYKALNGYSREHIPIQMEGAGTGTPVVSPYDIRKTGLLGEFAFHGTCANAIVVQKPA